MVRFHGNSGASFDANRWYAWLICAAIGILLGAVWASRALNVFSPSIPTSLPQVIAIITMILIGVALYNKNLASIITTRHLAIIAITCLLLHILAVLSTAFMNGQSEILSLGIVSVCTEGLFLGIVEYLLFTQLAVWAQERHGTVAQTALAIAMSFLIANIYDALFLSAPSGVILAQWIISEVLALGIFIAAERMTLAPAKATSQTASAPPQTETNSESGTITKSETESIFTTMPTPAFVSPLSAGITIACIAILMLIQGVFSHLTGLGAVGDHAFFGMSTVILMLGVRLLAIVLALAVVAWPNWQIMIGGCATVWMIGLAIITTAQVPTDNTAQAGMLIIEAGMYLLQVLALVWAATCGLPYEHESQDNGINHSSSSGPIQPQSQDSLLQRCRLIAFTLAAVFSNQITRTLPLTLSVSDVGAGMSLSGVVMITLLVVTAVFDTLILVTQTTRTTRNSTSNAASPIASESQSPLASSFASGSPTGSLAAAEQDFMQRFERFCTQHNLSDREREVLFLSLHGRTTDNIGDILGVSRETAKTYASRVYRRCGVGGRQEILSIMDGYGKAPSNEVVTSGPTNE